MPSLLPYLDELNSGSDQNKAFKKQTNQPNRILRRKVANTTERSLKTSMH